VLIKRKFLRLFFFYVGIFHRHRRVSVAFYDRKNSRQPGQSVKSPERITHFFFGVLFLFPGFMHHRSRSSFETK
jgi:hypothetical protein